MGHGMPSAHTQFIFFFVTFLTALMVVKWRSKSRIVSGIQIAVLWTIAVYVAIGRVFLKYHSSSQVVVGAMVGSLLGAMWFVVYNKSQGLFLRLESSSMAQFLGMCHSEALREQGQSKYEWARAGSLSLRRKKIKAN